MVTTSKATVGPVNGVTTREKSYNRVAVKQADTDAI